MTWRAISGEETETQACPVYACTRSAWESFKLKKLEGLAIGDDIMDQSFYESRKVAIGECLSHIAETNNVAQLVGDTFTRHYELYKAHWNRGVRGSVIVCDPLMYPCRSLQFLAAALGGPALAGIIRRMLKKSALNGFPDLTCLKAISQDKKEDITKTLLPFSSFKPDRKSLNEWILTEKLRIPEGTEFRIRFVEVKTTDKLKYNQTLWLNYLRSQIDAGVLRVKAKWISDSTE
mmetsp:Transcript_11521/g.14135  ORF Transcript_11521/g.14135 Transcript_11521/m.14135 type:complete len:234 (+) Transcript_11521:484-1185(+)